MLHIYVLMPVLENYSWKHTRNHVVSGIQPGAQSTKLCLRVLNSLTLFFFLFFSHSLFLSLSLSLSHAHNAFLSEALFFWRLRLFLSWRFPSYPIYLDVLFKRIYLVQWNIEVTLHSNIPQHSHHFMCLVAIMLGPRL